MKSILIIIDYFGAWPAWIEMFWASCRTNPTVNWLINTDCAIPDPAPSNIKFVQISSQDYCANVSRILEIDFNPDGMYNICNIRPAFGIIYEKEIFDYDYFGWSDVDLVYGDLRSIYTDGVMQANVLSAKSYHLTGSLSLLRNVQWLRHAFLDIGDWRQRMEFRGRCEWLDTLDEAGLSSLFSPARRARFELARSGSPPPPPHYWLNNLFVERYATPFGPMRWLDGEQSHPEIWYWQAGKLTNARDAPRAFPYLHFMNFKARRNINWNLYADSPTWEKRTELIGFDCLNLGNAVVEISRAGFRIVDDVDPFASGTAPRP